MIQSFPFFLRSIATVVIEFIAIVVIEFAAIIHGDNGLMFKVGDSCVVKEYLLEIKIACFDHMRTMVGNEITWTNHL